MKKKIKGIIIRSLLITVMLLMVPMLATAMGNSEKPYPEVLETEFTDIVEALESGAMDREQALEQLHAFRTEYNREDNEDYQTMEGLLVAVKTQTMTKEQALVQLRELNECKDEGDELKNQEQLKITTQTKEEAATQTKAQTSQPSTAGSNSGTSNGGSSDKTKSKK